MKSFLLDSDAYKTNNASHKNKKIIYQIAIIPYGSNQKLVRLTYLKPYIKKYLMKFFLQMRFRSTYTYLTKI